MKAIKLFTLLLLLITTNLLTGCMPDSLTKWNADPPQQIQEPVEEHPIAPTYVSYAQTEFILSTDTLISLQPSSDGTQLSYEMFECTGPTDLVCDQVADISTNFPGYSFDKTTGIISGQRVGDTYKPTKYYKVTASNSEISPGAEPAAYLNITTYAPLSRETTAMSFKKGTKLVITVDNADSFDYTGDPDDNEKRHIVNKGNGGKALINYIDTSDNQPVLYAEFTEDGLFDVGDFLDVGTDGYATKKAEIVDLVIALPSGLTTSQTPSEAFLTFNITKGDAVWNSSPLLPENRFLEIRDTNWVVTEPASIPIQQDSPNENLWSVSIKGTSDCYPPHAAPYSTNEQEQIDKCLSTINSSLTKTKYTLTLSNPLMTSEEDYITYDIQLSFSQAPKFIGYGQFAIVRVQDGSMFNIGDVISSRESDGDLYGVVVNVDLNKTAYATLNTPQYDKLYIQIFHGIPVAGVQVGQTYPLTGNGVTQIISHDDEERETLSAGYKITAFSPYSAVLEIGKSDGTNNQSASTMFVQGTTTNSPQRPRPFFLVDSSTYTTGSAASIHTGWIGQAYMLDASDTVKYNNASTGLQNLYIMSTEMSGFMDGASTSDLSNITNLATNNYYTNDFRDANSNEFFTSAGAATASNYRLYDTNSGVSYYIASFKQGNLKLSDGGATCNNKKGAEVTFAPNTAGKWEGLAGQIMQCDNSTGTALLNVQLYPYSLLSSISSWTAGGSDTWTQKISDKNPYDDATASSISEVHLDKVFYVTIGENASILLFQSEGSNVSYSITPELPTGLFLNPETGHLQTVDKDGNNTVIDAAPGRTDYKLTAFNALGRVDYYFSIEVVSSMRITNSLAGTVDSYIIHKAGQSHQRSKCEITQAQIENTQDQDIICYVDAGENELHNNGIGFKLNVSKDLCTSVVYKPYFYYRDRFADVRFEQIAGQFSDAACAGTASQLPTNYTPIPSSWYSGTDGTSFNLTADSASACNYFLPGHRSLCGVGKIIVTTQLDKDEDGTCVTYVEPHIFDCSEAKFSFANCLGGAGADYIAKQNVSDPFSPFFQPFIKDVELNSTAGLQNEIFSHKVTPTSLGKSNRFYSNYTKSNACNAGDDYNYYAQSWADYAENQQAIIDYASDHDASTIDYDPFSFQYFSTNLTEEDETTILHAGATNYYLNFQTYGGGEHFLAIADPFKLAQPFYTFECLDPSRELKARIRVVVRDWDEDFKAQDSIDKLQPDKMISADQSLNNYQEWDTVPDASNLFHQDLHYIGDQGNVGGVVCSATNSPQAQTDIDGDSYEFTYYLGDGALDYFYTQQGLTPPTHLPDERASTGGSAESVETGMFYGFPSWINEPSYQHGMTTVPSTE